MAVFFLNTLRVEWIHKLYGGAIMNSIINTGLQGMYHSQQAMRNTAHAIASTPLTPTPASSQVTQDPGAPAAPTMLQPSAPAEQPSEATNNRNQHQGLEENIVSLRRQEQLFTASASVVKVGAEAVGSLIDDYS